MTHSGALAGKGSNILIAGGEVFDEVLPALGVTRYTRSTQSSMFCYRLRVSARLMQIGSS